MQPLYTYSKFEVLIIYMLHNMYDVIDFDSTHESQYKFESRSNTKILTRSLCVWSARCSVFFAYVSFHNMYDIIDFDSPYLNI